MVPVTMKFLTIFRFATLLLLGKHYAIAKAKIIDCRPIYLTPASYTDEQKGELLDCAANFVNGGYSRQV